MVTGTAAAQIIPLVVSPLLSRIYSAADFGTLGTTVAIASVLAVLSTARLELAIVLPAESRDGLALAGGVLLLAPAVCVLAWIALSAAEMLGALPVGLANLGIWLHAAPFLGLALACSSTGSFLANRDRSYRRIATAAVTQQAVTAIVAVTAGLAKVSSNGLLVGRIVGAASNVALYSSLFRSVATAHGSEWRLVDTWKNVVRYKQFVFFNLPYSFVGTFSREFVVIALTLTHALEAAGFYSLVRAVLAAPVSFLSSALSQVYYREAAERAGSPEFSRLTFGLMIGLTIALTPCFTFLSIWGATLFSFVFGASWEEAGAYAQLLALPGLLSLLTSWPERIFEVRAKQGRALGIQLFFDALSIGVLVWSLRSGASPLLAIAFFAAAQTLYHLVYLTAVFKLVPVQLENLALLLTFVGVLATVVWGVHGSLVVLGVAPLGIFTIDAVVCLSVSGLGLAQLRRKLKLEH